VVGYNVQVAIETEHHPIVTHDVPNVDNDPAQSAPMTKAAQQTLDAESPHVIADRGYGDGEQVKECVEAGLTVTLPKQQT
jgi:transposase